MPSTSSGTRAVASARLDRAGRNLVRVGGLVTVVLVALPALGGLALFTLIFAGGEGSVCDSLGCHPFLWLFALPALGVVVAVIVTIWRMVRGGTVALTLGGIAAFIAGSATLVLLYLRGDGGRVLAVQVAVVAASAFALALGSALRLIARRQAQRGG